MSLVLAEPAYCREIGDDLLLRWSTIEDTEKIVQLIGMVFRQSADEPPNQLLMHNVRRQMRDTYALMGPGDYALVEDTRKEDHPLVACSCLWHLEWCYEGITFGVGQPEFVATDPAYRNRGLIRAVFEMLHARSEARGDLVQGITGIPYFYRQFGYTYALDLDGGRTTPVALIPPLAQDKAEPYALREATLDDVPYLAELYATNVARSQSIVHTVLPESYWRYHVIEGSRSFPLHKRDAILMIVDGEKCVQGYLVVDSHPQDGRLHISALEIAPEVNLVALAPSLLRGLQAYGEQLLDNNADGKALTSLNFTLGQTHPIYEALGQELAPLSHPPYAWYIRVPHVPALIRHIAPVLKQRLHNSILTGYTGEVKITFYRTGLRMAFTQGQLVDVETWQPPIYNANPGAGFPELVFLQLLFGYRSLADLRYAHPDVWANQESSLLLNILFPSRPSRVMALS